MISREFDAYFAGSLKTSLGNSGYMAVLEAYCDETGTHGGAPLTAVGGYLFNQDGVKLFNDKWSEVLRPLTAKGIEYFHARDCCNPKRTTPFNRLTDEEANKFVLDLIALIRETVTAGFIVGIENSAFVDAKSETIGMDMERVTGSKYTLCVSHCLHFIGQWVEQKAHPEDEIVYYFEAGCAHSTEAHTVMNRIEKNDVLRKQYRYAGHGFHPKRLHKPLQAADLLVWQWQRAFALESAKYLYDTLWKQPGAKPHYVRHLPKESVFATQIVNVLNAITPDSSFWPPDIGESDAENE